MPDPTPAGSLMDPARTFAQSPASAYLGSVSKGSARTVQQSLAVLAELLAGPGADPVKLKWERLTRDETVDIRQKLREKYAAATANKILSVLRGVLRKSRDLGLMDEGRFQAAASLEHIKAEDRQEAKPVDVAGVVRLYRACESEPGAAGLRDAALLSIFLCSGLRRAEATTLNVADYDPARGRLQITGERPEYSRQVELPGFARRALDAWLAVRTPAPGPLLTPVDRTGLIRFRRVTHQAIYDIFSRIAERAGLSGVTLRDLRRSYAVGLIQSGKSPAEVQYLVGRASWLTGAAYTGLASGPGGFDLAELERVLAKGGR